MQQIQWYPGHMTKARRMIERNLALIDVVVEIVDARAPHSTRNPDFDSLFAGKRRLVILNKADLADEKITAEWVACYKRQGRDAMSFVATGSDGKRAVEWIGRAVQGRAGVLRQKGIAMTTRALVAGIPNVGKSTFINCVAGGARSKTGDKPGVTKGKQWIGVSPYLEIMDTPGLLWPKFVDQAAAVRLAFLGSVNDLILDAGELAESLLLFLQETYSRELIARYKKLTENTLREALLEQVSVSRGFLTAGGGLDVERAAKTVLDEFRAAKITRATLERPGQFQEYV